MTVTVTVLRSAVTVARAVRFPTGGISVRVTVTVLTHRDNGHTGRMCRAQSSESPGPFHWKAKSHRDRDQPEYAS